MKLYDIVTLKHAINELKKGDTGTIVHVYKKKNVYEVEFNSKKIVLTLTESSLNIKDK